MTQYKHQKLNPTLITLYDIWGLNMDKACSSGSCIGWLSVAVFTMVDRDLCLWRHC